MKDYFEEIKGYEEVKAELRVISDMLVNPQIYKNMGSGINEGLLLYGKPGTGKTTLANCFINSVNRKAFVCRKKASDGEFVKEIADTFEKAIENAPSIVLLDDLDKFSDTDEGNKGDPEEFVTIQSCIDEVKGKDVFVLATANNIRKIPESLKRAGRLGKKILVRLPEKNETEMIVKHYLGKLNNCEDLDEESIARMLVGESCAALENVINGAGMKAAYNRQDKITMQNVLDSCLDLIFEAPACPEEMSEEVKRKTAYHEAGHALVAELLDPGCVSIISVRKTTEGKYGFVKYCRSDERYDTDVEFNETVLKASLAGRAATELVFGETDMGANSDMHNAFFRARLLADNNCMFGFQSWIEDEHDVFVAENRNRAMTFIMERSYLEVKKLLARNRSLLDIIALELMEKTTLVRSDINRIMG